MGNTRLQGGHCFAFVHDDPGHYNTEMFSHKQHIPGLVQAAKEMPWERDNDEKPSFPS